jgi:hypothetical protein
MGTISYEFDISKRLGCSAASTADDHRDQGLAA